MHGYYLWNTSSVSMRSTIIHFIFKYMQCIKNTKNCIFADDTHISIVKFTATFRGKLQKKGKKKFYDGFKYK